MPAGDVTHPVPDLDCRITEGQIVLSEELHGIYPPFEASPRSRALCASVPGRTHA